MTNQNSDFMSPHRKLWALGLHSSAIIAFQLILMQLISIMQWYHFAYMIISIAMLGFGASGTFIALFRKRLLEVSSWLVPLLMCLSGLFMLVSFRMARLSIFQFDVNLLFVEFSQFPVLAANYLIFFIPFFLGALAIGIIFIENTGSIGKYYFANLIGSGAGGMLVVVLLSYLFAIHALPVAASLSVVASLIIPGRKNKGVQFGMASLSMVLIVYTLIVPGSVPLSEYKSLSRSLNLPDAEIIFSKPDIHGRIDVASSPAMRYAPALSLTFTGEVPVKKNVFTNADYYGVIPHYDTSSTNIHDFTTEALPYIMRSRDTILVLNAGTGSNISHALQNKARKVYGITEVKGVKEIMQKEFAHASNDLFLDHRVNIIYQDSRQALFTRQDTAFDAIILPRMESFGGSTGLNALSENYSLTREAFLQMWDKLSEHGVIVVTSWMDYPPRTTLKLLASLAETLRYQGVEDPSQHIAAIRSWGTITFAMKKTPLQQEETDRIREFCKKMLFDPAFLPDITRGERSTFNALEDDGFFAMADLLLSDNYQQLYDKYDFHIRPATDDKPYFSRFLKASGMKELMDKVGSDTLPFLELGYLILWVTLIQSTLLAILLIILPLFRLRRQSPGKTPTLIYFGALGLGYMFVEIIFIQRFILYFGHPVYAVAAVISVMMIASGMGSLYSQKIRDAVKLARISTFGASIILLVYAVFFTSLLTSTIHFPLTVKVLIAFFLISLPSFFMGMPFPSGIRILSANKKDQIPWAWGINGCLSVIATSFATLVAVESGFRTVMYMAVIFYLLAFLVFVIYRNKHATS